MIKIITLTPFQAAIEVDSQNKIIRTPKRLSNFLNLPFSILEESLKKQVRYFKVEDIIDG